MSRPSIPNTFTPERKARFLEVLADTCSPKQAAAAVGIVRSTAFYHRANDMEFRAAWDKALEVLMKFRYGDQLAERLRVKVEDTGLSAEGLLAMPADERAQLVALLSKYNAARPQGEDDAE